MRPSAFVAAGRTITGANRLGILQLRKIEGWPLGCTRGLVFRREMVPETVGIKADFGAGNRHFGLTPLDLGRRSPRRSLSRGGNSSARASATQATASPANERIAGRVAFPGAYSRPRIQGADGNGRLSDAVGLLREKTTQRVAAVSSAPAAPGRAP
jgi:hypothetical protein